MVREKRKAGWEIFWAEKGRGVHRDRVVWVGLGRGWRSFEEVASPVPEEI